MNTLPKLLEVCKSVPADEEKYEYPGNPAKFVYHSGSWKPYDSGGPLNHSIEFRSKTSKSLLKAFSILGYIDGDVSIGISFTKSYRVDAKEVEDIIKYFRQYDIILTWIDIDSYYRTNGVKQLTNMFNILAENNEIPPEYFKDIRKIVEDCNTRT